MADKIPLTKQDIAEIDCVGNFAAFVGNNLRYIDGSIMSDNTKSAMGLKSCRIDAQAIVRDLLEEKREQYARMGVTEQSVKNAPPKAPTPEVKTSQTVDKLSEKIDKLVDVVAVLLAQQVEQGKK